MDEIESVMYKNMQMQGLISVSAEDNNPRPNAQRDSLADDAIRLLYNIEPEPEKKKSIIELAHPETSVVGRAYDAMNAVVENEEQHQAMMAYIALKMPNGHLTQRRYVETKKELLDSLIRSAFTLDNNEEDGLMVLADSCAQRLSEREIKKEGIAAVPLAIAGAAAAILGLGYYFFAGAPPAEDVYQNSQKVINALEPLSNRSYAAPIRKDMATLMGMAKQVYAVKQQLVPIHSVDESISAAQKEDENKKAQVAHQILTNYMTQLLKVKEAIKGWVSAIRVMETEDTEERSEWSAKLHALTSYFTDTQEEKLIYALEGKADALAAIKGLAPGKTQATRGGLEEAIDQELVKFQGAVDVAKENAPGIQETLAQATAKTQEQPAPVSKDLPIASNEPQKKPTMEDLNKELFQQMGIAASRRW